MRVKTNLSSEELELVSKGLSRLAKAQQQDGRFEQSNPAEKALLSEVSDALDQMVDSLKLATKEVFDGE